MTTVFGDAKENLPAEGVAGLSTPEKLIGRCEHSGITTPAKKRMRTNSLPLSAIPVWRPEPSNIWTKVTKEYTAKYSRSGIPLSCPPSPVDFRIGQKRRHQDNNRCPCKRPFLDLSKMCEVSFTKFRFYFSFVPNLFQLLFSHLFPGTLIILLWGIVSNTFTHTEHCTGLYYYIYNRA